MRKSISAMGILWVMMLVGGCASTYQETNVPMFKFSGGNPVTSSSQFDEILANAQKYQGQAMKLAGAVVRIDETEEGYLALAKWLPYPQKQIEEGPKVRQPDGSRHFLIRFVGKREKKFHTTGGNKFFVDGRVEGIKKGLVDVFASRKDLLYINANCVHVWETGQVGIRSGAGDSDYPEARERTLCAD